MHTWSTTVVSPISSDTEPTILVNFDDAKYMFNVGENTNRAFSQSNQSWKRIRALFLTRVNTQRASGLGGMLMSFADTSISKLDIVGPPGLLHYIATMRFYLYRKKLDVSITETCPELGEVPLPAAAYKDKNVTVYSIPIIPSSDSSTDTQLPDLSPVPEQSSNKRKRSPFKDEPSKVPKLELDTTPSSQNSTNPESSQELRRELIELMFKPKSTLQINPNIDPNDALNIALDEYKRTNIPRVFYDQLPPFQYSDFGLTGSASLAYVLVGPHVRGHIDGKKLDDLGVPRSKLRSKLAAGETIEFEVRGPDGPEIRTVRPEEVMSKSESPAVVIILDVPSVAHIPSVISSFQNAYRTVWSSNPSDLEMYSVRVVYHLCGPGVLEDSRYVEFMNGFVSTAQHIVSSRDHCPNPVTFTSHAFNQLRLNQLDPDMFPVPRFSLGSKKSLHNIPNLPPNIRPISANLTVPIRPAGPLQHNTLLPADRFHPATTAADSDSTSLPLPQTTAAAFKKAKAVVAQHLASGRDSEAKDWDVTVLPLGTGSAVPNKYRNVSSTLIMIPKWGNILFDTGEGTWGQLIRRFGEDGVQDILRELKCIFISHAHADHHIGVAKILKQRTLLSPPPDHPLYLVTIRAVHLYLREYADLEDIGLNEDPNANGVVPIISDALNFRYDAYPTAGAWRVLGDEPWMDFNRSRQYLKKLCKSLGLSKFIAIDMHHRTRCFGAGIMHKNGWSIVFSGDTQPSSNIVKALPNPTLLIHEATMADDQEELAQSKAHSTSTQAIQVARDMNAENVLLTHFSARYPKMPPSIVANPGEDFPNKKEPIIALAFDHAELRLGMMWKMNLYLPAIEQCFRDTTDEGDVDLHANLEQAGAS